MRISPNIKIILGLVVVFLAGGTVGFWAHSKLAERIFLKFLDNRTWTPSALDSLHRDLHLTPKQEEKARVFLDESVREVTQDFSRMGDELARLHSRLQSILTPEQQEKNGRSYKSFRRELEQKYHIALPAPAALEKTPATPTNVNAFPGLHSEISPAMPLRE